MEAAETENLSAEIDERIKALERAQKQLKRPSTISFAERQDFTRKAAKAAAALQEQRAALGEGEPAEERVQEARAALSAADKVLGQVAAAQPTSVAHTGGAKSVGGNQRRSASGASQTRPPDRIGE